jgi:hypothetical protein
MRDRIAPAGTIWVCGACGKTSRDRYGDADSRGWDSSCMLHAVLCHEERKDGVWQAVKEEAP